MKKIKVMIRSVYGKDVIYPACEVSKQFARIAGTKTLTREVVQAIGNIGYRVEFQAGIGEETASLLASLG